MASRSFLLHRLLQWAIPYAMSVFDMLCCALWLVMHAQSPCPSSLDKAEFFALLCSFKKLTKASPCHEVRWISYL
jgi:hypothetical protein